MDHAEADVQDVRRRRRSLPKPVEPWGRGGGLGQVLHGAWVGRELLVL